MSEAADGGSADKVVQFRTRPAVRESVPYLTDDEKLAIRRLLAMEERIKLAVWKLEHLEHACPTAKREIRALLIGNE